jgi:hypothetical protein
VDGDIEPFRFLDINSFNKSLKTTNQEFTMDIIKLVKLLAELYRFLIFRLGDWKRQCVIKLKILLWGLAFAFRYL